MADSVWLPHPATVAHAAESRRARHSAVVRVTHWLTTLSFLALLLTGIEILISHPRFYWGEVGNVLTHPLFIIPIPSSRATVPTGYGYVLPDQNGWSRYLHFQAAWAAVLTGLFYLISGLLDGHFRRDLLPKSLSRVSFWNHTEENSYNTLQRLTYLAVIIILFPLIIWTGLAMSPAIASAFPWAVSILGGQQSARTIHFAITILLVLFLVVHVTMVCISGFRNRMRAMITGRASTDRPM